MTPHSPTLRFSLLLCALTLATACPSGVTVDVEEPEGDGFTPTPDPDMPSTQRPDMATPAPDMPGVDPDMGGPPAEDMPDDTPDMPPTPGPREPARYTGDRLLSPITPYVADRLAAIRDAASGADDMVFVKIGDSNTVNRNMIQCFADPGATTLGPHADLQATIDWFTMKEVGGGETSFDRTSLAAEVGRTAAWAQAGSPSPIEREVAALDPAFALVSYGTNDMQQGSDFLAALYPFYSAMNTLLDGLVADDVIPIVTGLPPRGDSASAHEWARVYNAVLRGMAEARQVPYIDLLGATEGLPDMGLVGDGLHGNSAPEGACVLTEGAMAYGFNVRNLLTLQTLDRVRRVVLEAAPAPDARAPVWVGDGTANKPLLVDSVPFAHAASTSGAPSMLFSDYSGCAPGTNEGGPEVIYAFTPSQAMTVRAVVLDEPGVDVDVHVLEGDLDVARCVARDDKSFTHTLSAGTTYYFVADTFVSSAGAQRAGEYLFVLMRED